jgi:DNA-binding HxlR family transcriptional regulator
MALLDLLGRRWAMRIIWELRDGGLGFRELQGRCDGMSSSVLSTRLRELREAGIVQAEDGGAAHELSREGELLLEAYAPLSEWAARWAARGPERPPAGDADRRPAGRSGDGVAS